MKSKLLPEELRAARIILEADEIHQLARPYPVSMEPNLVVEFYSL